jgi:uroporphyrinogen-III synthase
VTAEPLTRAGIASVQPARARLGALVRSIVEEVPARCGQALQIAGHRLELRGHAVVIDDVLVPLPAASMTLLRALVARPGHVVSRGELLKLTGASDEHAVEVTVGRLRTALGDPAVVRTVVKRGYRLDCEPVPVP